MLEHFCDTLNRFCRHHAHDKYHREHHHGCQNLNAIVDERGELAGCQCAAVRGNNDIGTNQTDEQHANINTNHHNRSVECQNLFYVCKITAHRFRLCIKLFSRVILSNKGFYHANARDIFLHRLIHTVIFLKNPFENREHMPCDAEQCAADNRNHHQKNQRDTHTDGHTHDDRENQHKRRSDCHTDNHLIGVLYIGDVRGHTRHQGRRGKCINIREGKILNFEKQILPQIFCKAARRGCRIFAGQCTAQQRQHCHTCQRNAILDNRRHAVACHIVNHARHDERKQTFQNHFQCDKQRRQQGFPLVLPDAAH